MRILEYIPVEIDSISINGLSKNAGKTTLLNQLLQEYHQVDRRIGVVSVGVDGERYDVWSGLQKPAIYVEPGVLVATSRLAIEEAGARFEILEKIKSSSIGHDVYLVRTIKGGHVKVTGTPSLHDIKNVLKGFRYYGADISLVDGAYDRIASSNPEVTAGTMIAVGAAYHRSLSVTVDYLKQWIFRYTLPIIAPATGYALPVNAPDSTAIWIDELSGEHISLSAPLQNGWSKGLNGEQPLLYLPGSCTGSVLKEATSLDPPPTIVIRDGTRLFAKGEEITSFYRQGGEIRVLRKNNLLGIAINPNSLAGYQFDGDQMLEVVKSVSGNVPVFDVVRSKMLT